MDKKYIIEALKSNDKSLHIKALQILIEGKDLSTNCTIDLGNGFVIDNEITDIHGNIFNDINVKFLGIELRQMLIQNKDLEIVNK